MEILRMHEQCVSGEGLLLTVCAYMIISRKTWESVYIGVGTKGALGASAPFYLQCVGIMKCFHTV